MPNRLSNTESATNLIESIIEDFKPTQWLAEETLRLACQDNCYFPCVSLGLIGRLTIGNMSPRDKKSILKKFPAREYPAKRVLNWWKNRREFVWPELEKILLRKIISLNEATFDMRSMDSESIAETATLWLRKRDNLESIIFLVGKDADWRVKPCLAEADRLARLYRHHFRRIISDQRINSVAVCQTDAWWATIALQHIEKPSNGK